MGRRHASYKPPFPYFGGKSPVAHFVWEALGNVDNYCEPFFGSGAVLFLRPGGPGRIETVNDADGFVCVAPETRLLAGDLTWKRASAVRVGDTLIGFDEHNGPAQTGIDRRTDRPAFQPPTKLRRWSTTTVTKVANRTTDCYRLTFEDGTTVVCSAEHQWLAGKSKIGGRGARWIKTGSLRCDSSQYASHVMKLCDVVDRDESFDSGWLSGFYDGEGNIKGTGSGWSISVCQKHGPELDRCEKLLQQRGFDVTRVAAIRSSDKHKPVSSLSLCGGMRACLRLLMMVRPERLLKTALQRMPERSIYACERQVVRLVRKEFLGPCEVVSIETDSHTFIAEGLASHNCNFWRALKHDSDAVAEHADNPVNEADLHARHLWLIGQRERITERLCGDPEFYDAKAAGWWCWGLACWIGSGWCTGKGPWTAENGEMVLRNPGQGVNRKLPHLGDPGKGVNRKLPHLGDPGKGVNRKLPHLCDLGQECDTRRQWLQGYLRWFADRLRSVRVCCGDWSRVCGPSVTFRHGLTGVFLDPPYADSADRTDGLYAVDCQQVAHDAREWAIEQGRNPLMRIVLAGYQDEHAMPDDWRVIEWEAAGGYGLEGGEESRGRINRNRERLWCSPACRAAKQGALMFAE